jgi:predicted tellurium resistance membrane protein TerC/Mg2+/Co2+ transporter CorC
MEWLFGDFTVLIGLGALIILEIVLGIDNLIFIAILTDKLPPAQRDKARLLGLFLALIMRLGLLTLLSWMVGLTEPLFSVVGLQFSGRDLILLGGGLFLLLKATMELHERLEGVSHVAKGPKVYAGFGVVVAQIVVLDAVFSIDSIITAIGIVDDLRLMVIAVIISMAFMFLASKPLTRFVNAHATIIVLCLSFLLMIGFSLVAEGLGFKIPKGYLYAAIGFSILIEFLNQTARRNSFKDQEHISFRERTAAAVMNMLLTNPHQKHEKDQHAHTISDLTNFVEEERQLVRGALTLGERTFRAIMTPREDISWINMADSIETIQEQLLNTPHNFVLVAQNTLDQLIGVARSKDLIFDLLTQRKINNKSIHAPVFVKDVSGVVDCLQRVRQSQGQLIVVENTEGQVVGVVSPLDILEAIAGEFPDEDEGLSIQPLGEGKWLVHEDIELYLLEQKLEVTFDVTADCLTLTEFLKKRLQREIQVGDSIQEQGYELKILAIQNSKVKEVSVTWLLGAGHG